MTAEEMAEIHKAAMTIPQPWGVPTFADFLERSSTVYHAEPGGFALGRVVADEAELLTLAVLPCARRRGIAARCLAALEAEVARRGASRLFLEVAKNNTGAKELYVRAGYDVVGTRPDYYRPKHANPVAALVMAKRLADA